jgi:hypothetical protein
MKATTATPRRRLTDHDTDAWQQYCATQERSSSTTATDGDYRDRFKLSYDRPSLKIAFRDPWGNTVSETELIYNPTLKFATDLQLD